MLWPDGFAQTTKRVYRNSMQAFRLFMHSRTGQTGKDLAPKSLVDRRVKDLQNRTFEFEQLVVDYFVWLKTTYVTRAKRVTVIRRNPAKRPHPISTFYPGGKKLADKSRQGYTEGIRSFFAYHRLDMRFTRQQRLIVNKRPKPVFTDYVFDLDDIEKMKNCGDPQERYIALVGKDIGLRAVDFGNLKQGRFANVLDKDPPAFLGKIYTQKEGTYAFPFLTADGLEAARVWLQILESKEKRDDNSAMLPINHKELTPNVQRLCLKAGINPHGQRMRFHCFRKFLIDRISLRMSESKWKQIVGKQIDESAYVSPLELREAYLNVMHYIQIPSAETAGLAPKDVAKLKEILKLMDEGKIKIRKVRQVEQKKQH